MQQKKFGLSIESHALEQRLKQALEILNTNTSPTVHSPLNESRIQTNELSSNPFSTPSSTHSSTSTTNSFDTSTASPQIQSSRRIRKLKGSSISPQSEAGLSFGESPVFQSTAITAPQAPSVTSTDEHMGAFSTYTRIKKSAEVPKRSKSGFLFFSADKREEVKRDHPELKSSHIMCELGRRWAALSEKDKLYYHNLAAAEDRI
ncbi:hypothetical protein GEMRC1_013920 [Eukaryota sp. GEM-RC1]